MTARSSIPSSTFLWAGLLYVLIIVFGIFGEALLRAPAIVAGDAEATAANIVASGGGFYLSLATDLGMLLCDVAVAVLLFVIFRPVSRTGAFLSAGFRLTQTAILGVNLLNLYAGASLVMQEGNLAGFSSEQTHALALFFLELQSTGYDLGLFFFAMTCFVFGWLIVRAAFAPKALGYIVAAAGAVYLAGSTSAFFAPEYREVIAYAYVIPVIAEVWFAVWLLTRGLRGGVAPVVPA